MNTVTLKLRRPRPYLVLFTENKSLSAFHKYQGTKYHETLSSPTTSQSKQATPKVLGTHRRHRRSIHLHIMYALCSDELVDALDDCVHPSLCPSYETEKLSEL